MCQGFSYFFSIFASFCIGQISHQLHKGYHVQFNPFRTVAGFHNHSGKYLVKATPIYLLVLHAQEVGNEPFWNKKKS